MLCGAPPFVGNNDAIILENVMRGEVSLQSLENVSADAVDLITICLQKDHRRRPSAEELIAFPWFKSIKHVEIKYDVGTFLQK